MIFNIKFEVPDPETESFFKALQFNYPLEEGEQQAAYLNRVTKIAFENMSGEGLIKITQAAATKAIMYPKISVTTLE